MSDLGVAVSMGYTQYASSTSSEQAAAALSTYFSYDATPALSASVLGMSTIERLLKEELEAGFPIYVSGMNRGGGKLYGHAWVVDGVECRRALSHKLWLGRAKRWLLFPPTHCPWASRE